MTGTKIAATNHWDLAASVVLVVAVLRWADGQLRTVTIRRDRTDAPGPQP